MAAFLFSCSQKDAEPKGKSSLQSSAKPKIEVKLIGEVLTRKSYASIQFMKDQEEIDAYLEKQHSSNPTISYEADSISKYLISQFERLGLIKNGELLLQNFKKQTKEKTIYSDSSGREISLVFFHSQVTDHYHFKLLSATDSVEIDTGGTNLQDLDYAFLDVIPGGNKELVYLNDYYIMNGDNFDFMIYEIKIH
jgi:hypothetical protein